MTRLIVILLAFASGFISLSYEILWARTFSMAVQSRAYAFAMLLALFLTGIAIGSRVATKMSERHPPKDQTQLRAIAMFIGASAIAGWAVVPVMAWFLSLPYPLPPFTALYAVAAAAVFLGAQLPLLAHYGIAPDDRAGIWMSYLYGANILGSVGGSLLTGFVFADLFTLDQIVVGLTCAALLLSIVLYWSTRPSPKQGVGWSVLCIAAAVGAVVSGPAAYEQVYERVFYGPEYDGQEFVYVVENKSGVLAVDAENQVFGGGVYDGTFSIDLVDDVNGVLRPYSLSAWHPNPKSVLVIGLATGSWARILAAHPQVERLVIIEINPGYLGLLHDYPIHSELLTDSKVEIVIDDGRRWLNANDEKFDAVISNTTYHWVSSASNLLSVEFLELVEEHMNPGAIIMLNTTGSARAVKSAFEVFGESHFYLRSAVAGPDPIEVDRERLKRILLEYRIDGVPTLDMSNPVHRARLDEIMQDLRPESPIYFTPEQLAPEMEGVEPITDDNMGHEWKISLFD